MAVFEQLSIGKLHLTPRTVAQIEADGTAKNGDIAFATDDTNSGACLVAYQDSGWVVVETGAAMAD